MEIVKIRKFTNGWVAAIRLSDGRLIESTNTCLPLHTELRGFNNKRTTNTILSYDFTKTYFHEKNMVGVSTQSGCPIMCKFCAVNAVTRKHGWRNLTDDEIVQQVDFALKVTKDLFNYDYFESKPKLFRILFTRMGEPSLNIENVVNAIRKLKHKFPEARVQISTIGIPESKDLVHELMKLEDELSDHDFLELQFSIHSTDMNFRRWLQTPRVMDNSEINKLAQEFYYKHPRKWKVTLNFTLSQKTPFDVNELRKQFDPDCVFIKLSPLNENLVSESNNLKTLIKQENYV